MSDIFYNTRELSKDQFMEILRDAKELSTGWRLDILDCSKSWMREPTGIMDFEEALNHLDGKQHRVVIERHNYDGIYGEVSVSTLCKEGGDHFLFIYLSRENLQALVKKHKLTPHP